jgi:hypothetical protein
MPIGKPDYLAAQTGREHLPPVFEIYLARVFAHCSGEQRLLIEYRFGVGVMPDCGLERFAGLLFMVACKLD